MQGNVFWNGPVAFFANFAGGLAFATGHLARNVAVKLDFNGVTVASCAAAILAPWSPPIRLLISHSPGFMFCAAAGTAGSIRQARAAWDWTLKHLS